MRGNPFKYTDPSGEYANKWQMQLNDRCALAERDAPQYRWTEQLMPQFELEQGLAQQFAEGEANDMREHLAGVALFHAAWAQSLKISGLMQPLSLRQVLLFGNTSASSSTDTEDDTDPGMNTEEDKDVNWDLNGDGKFTINESYNWWKVGNGKTIDLPLSSLDLTGIHPIHFNNKVGNTAVINVFNHGSISHGLVFGSITLKLYPDNEVRAFYDNYNFDYKSWWTHPIRNTSNFIGQQYHGAGKSYDITLSGSIYITATPWWYYFH